jgi:hypothetical protein
MPKPDANHLIEIAQRGSFLKLEEDVDEWTTSCSPGPYPLATDANRIGMAVANSQELQEVAHKIKKLL